MFLLRPVENAIQCPIVILRMINSLSTKKILPDLHGYLILYLSKYDSEKSWLNFYFLKNRDKLHWLWRWKKFHFWPCTLFNVFLILITLLIILSHMCQYEEKKNSMDQCGRQWHYSKTRKELQKKILICRLILRQKCFNKYYK